MSDHINGSVFAGSPCYVEVIKANGGRRVLAVVAGQSED